MMLVAISMCALVSCSIFDSSSPFSGDAGTAAYVTGDYKIGPEDVLEIIVWRNADLTKVVQVRPDGKISLPLIGDVTAVGLTADQLTKELQSRLKEFKESPLVSVVVQQVNSYNVYVMGEVTRPGKYPLKAYSTILQAISQAGGFTLYANKNKMFVLRKLPGKAVENRINVRYDDIVSGNDSAQNVVLIPGDTLVVP